ncbi:hypothetical protein Fmac_005984 [Flemingia macrophylla]|uniref:Uncharacterized protein n=1 Tax=Flemingia macrophylla TaxID=520843 RepID=A0ABD1N9F8_9FABA
MIFFTLCNGNMKLIMWQIDGDHENVNFSTFFFKVMSIFLITVSLRNKMEQKLT